METITGHDPFQDEKTIARRSRNQKSNKFLKSIVGTPPVTSAKGCHKTWKRRERR
jgi:hypothetical protein